MKEKNSIDIEKASISMAISSRQEEGKLIEEFNKIIFKEELSDRTMLLNIFRL